MYIKKKTCKSKEYWQKKYLKMWEFYICCILIHLLNPLAQNPISYKSKQIMCIILTKQGRIIHRSGRENIKKDDL